MADEQYVRVLRTLGQVIRHAYPHFCRSFDIRLLLARPGNIQVAVHVLLAVAIEEQNARVWEQVEKPFSDRRALVYN